MNLVPKIAFERGYRVLPDGSVINPRGRKLKCSTDRYGYRFLDFCRSLPYCLVSRLVAYQKYGDRIFASGIQVRHLDGNRQNNHPDNIEIGTQSQNAMDMPLEERRLRAAKAATTRSGKRFDPVAVREFYLQTRSQHKTMLRFGIKSTFTIRKILFHTPGLPPVPKTERWPKAAQEAAP